MSARIGSRWALCSLALLAAAAAPAQTSPTLVFLSPTSMQAGSAAFTLGVVGSNFVVGSTVVWNGIALPTTYLNQNQLSAAVSSSLVATPGTILVAVTNPGAIQSNAVSFTVTQPPLAISTVALPSATAGVAYTFTLLAGGGTQPYTWTSTGALPAGLSLSPNGTLSGTPTTPGSFSIPVRATDAVQNTVTASLVLTVYRPPLAIANDATLPAGVAGQSYSVTLQPAGGTAPYQWSAQNLPAGLALGASTGVLSGAPTATGKFAFTVQVADQSQLTASKTFTLTVTAPPLVITTTTPLFAGTVGSPYSQPFTASGGVPPYRWSILSGDTGGLLLDASSGALRGTPQITGTYAFTVQVADREGTTAAQAFSLVVNAPTLTITTNSPLPNAAVGTAYTQAFSVLGGTAPYSWSLAAGFVPGLTVNASSGTLAGTPESAGTYNFSIQVRDSAGLTGTKAFTLTVGAAALRITTGTQLPDATVAAAYSTGMAAIGGVAPYSWTANGLPEGLSMDAASGAIRGTPRVAGSFVLTVRVTDAARATAIDLFRLNVGLPPVPALTISGLPDTVNPAAQHALAVALEAPYAITISGQLLLSFAPDSGGGDATIQFASGGRTAEFTIPAGSTEASFEVPEPALQTGTVAGTIILSARLQSGGIDITPVPAPSASARVERGAPVISGARLTRTGTGFEIEITGFCTAREVTQATFRFSAASGKTLQAGEVTVALESLFSSWFQDASSSRSGSQFRYTQPFTVEGDAAAVTPQSVTLTNRQGSTTANITP